MNAAEQEACERLRSSCELGNPNQIEEYLHAIGDLRGATSEDVLREMLLCLRDTDAGEVQYELLEACENFPDSVYVRVFLDVGRRIEESAPKWFELALQSILNSASCQQLAVTALGALPPELRSWYVGIVERLRQHTPKYQRFLDAV